MAKEYRGSQKHILDLLDSGTAGIAELNAFLAPFEGQISPNDVHRPKGRPDAKEFYLPSFCKEYCSSFLDSASIADWWVPSPWRPPTWDLISTFTTNQRQRGLLLVEAKAHENEFDWGGKNQKAHASIGSKNNHTQIVGCLNEANKALNDSFDGHFRLAVDLHYQLSNRVAHLWKLATCKIPVILLYLGFCGDREIEPSYFRGEEHWQRSMGGYLQGVVPQSFLNAVHPLSDGGSMLMLSRSLPVLSVSPTRKNKQSNS